MHLLNIGPETVFQALSDMTRIRIVRLLSITKEEACLCELTDSLGVPDYKLSRHVKVLKQAGFLSAEKEGRWVYHRLIEDSGPYNLVYKIIRDLPDLNNLFKSDLTRFQKRKKIRISGRCKTENIIQDNSINCK